uniref:Ig-like domain-containing protein n=1 Tax=Kryptolebias marmoratus TaxID=37003 RepID=A0A3Q3EEX3_KRYMA
MCFYAFLGFLSCSHDAISASVLEVTVRPGDNITLYCDCKVSTGVYIVWSRNCSHEHQPPLVIKLKGQDIKHNSLQFPRFEFEKNLSSNSYDLVITNVTISDEGLYYCGTGERKVEEKQSLTFKDISGYGNITTRLTGEDVSYAALEILQTSHRAKKKRTIQSSDFSTYSTVRS